MLNRLNIITNNFIDGELELLHYFNTNNYSPKKIFYFSKNTHINNYLFQKIKLQDINLYYDSFVLIDLINTNIDFHFFLDKIHNLIIFSNYPVNIDNIFFNIIHSQNRNFLLVNQIFKNNYFIKPSISFNHIEYILDNPDFYENEVDDNEFKELFCL